MIQSASFENRTIDLLSNPFGYAVDSSNQNLVFAPDSMIVSVPFLGKSCHQNVPCFDNHVEQTNDFLFYLLLFTILGIVVWGASAKINLKSFFKIGFSEKLMQDHEKKQVSNNPMIISYFLFSSLVFLTVITYTFFQNEVSFLNTKFVIYLLLGLISCLIFKMLLVFLLGAIFRCVHLSKEFNKKLIIMYSSLMFFLLIPALLVLSVSANACMVLFIISIFLLVFMMFFRDVKFFRKQISKNKSFIFFFIYLCTLEILGIPLIAKLLYVFVL